MTLPDKFIDVTALRPGKSATVNRAKNKLTGRDVFLKSYPVCELDALSTLREPQLLTELAHDNLSKIYSADILTSNEVLLEMEFVNGGSFRDFINQSSKNQQWPSVHKCVELIADVAAGLSHLATQGFVHRDVKPANLLIRSNGARKQGVVADLGLVTRLNESGRAFATKHSRLYRPPEVWEGNGYSRKSDIYQLGIVLFQLLGGHLDYSQKDLDDTQLSAKAAKSEIISVDSLAADVGPHLRKVIQKAIAPESKRHESMSEFVVDLNRAKLRELDWSYMRIENGFELTRTVGNSAYKVTVTCNESSYTARRFKAGRSGSFREKKPAQVFACKNLETNKDFRAFLNW